MKTPRTLYGAPLTFDLTLPQIQKIEAVRRARALRSASEVVRLAIAGFDITKYVARSPRHRQISVRLDPAMREKLRRHAEQKNVSIGRTSASGARRPAGQGWKAEEAAGQVISLRM
jgi:Arc/MetJ-type ribon-helix-helix transcriptional regulator